ncbi:hypothetical protein ACFW4T_12070, partial [Streptomyces mutabilis]|uniref:hypothetical protein n=1 Tax=Streptomyces mutabilis TaxID=67332 RepID=UPI0036B7E65F
MERSRPLARRPLVTLLTVAALAASGMTALSSAAPAAAPVPAREGGVGSGRDRGGRTARPQGD